MILKRLGQEVEPVTETMCAPPPMDYLVERGSRGSLAAFEAVSRKVPGRLPLPGDEWPPLGRPEPKRAARRSGVRRRKSAKAVKKSRASLERARNRR